ncbi:Hypp7425 [Branchiostoma lanceolatum]|uniref:Hypp7425 protein n=1 Tax=Branchiostoma lanceolatum TaxID=7740 RepID=A0A8K0EBG7_BRALA|nr:Hypp7425 [Branchiostoma lanceolatum]
MDHVTGMIDPWRYQPVHLSVVATARQKPGNRLTPALRTPRKNILRTCRLLSCYETPARDYLQLPVVLETT